jgi:hypothetical protein
MERELKKSLKLKREAAEASRRRKRNGGAR